jgi:hypothetical protein
MDGGPTALEIEFTNAAFNSLLDLLEDQFTTWPAPGHTKKRDESVTGGLPSSGTPVAMQEEEADEIDDLDIEDAVIRELARALQSRRG